MKSAELLPLKVYPFILNARRLRYLPWQVYLTSLTVVTIQLVNIYVFFIIYLLSFFYSKGDTIRNSAQKCLLFLKDRKVHYKYYLISFLHITYFLRSRWVDGGECFTTHRVYPFIVDKQLKYVRNLLQFVYECQTCKVTAIVPGLIRNLTHSEGSKM